MALGILGQTSPPASSKDQHEVQHIVLCPAAV